MYFWTSDEHYGHFNMLRYSKRPFETIEEMNDTLIQNNNEIVSDDDIVVHVGDFTLKSKQEAEKYIKRLKGKHTFLRGSHDYWLPKKAPTMWEMEIEGQYVVACHYCFRVWPKSHYGSYNVYGHSHGNLAPIGKQWDVGVDNNNFYPVSFDQLKEIMKKQPDNFNLVKSRR